VVIEYIDDHRERVVEGKKLGVEPICAVLKEAGVQIAPRIYWAAKTRVPSKRALWDEELAEEIQLVFVENYGCTGRGKFMPNSTVRGPRGSLHGRALDAPTGLTGSPAWQAAQDHCRGVLAVTGGLGRPQLHRRSAEPTLGCGYHLFRTFSGWVYASFVVDVFSRMVVGWQVSTSLHMNLALDALEMGIWARKRAGQDVTGLVHHSDRGVRYRAIRYTERMAEAEVVASVGSRGDSYDNAMAEAFNSLFTGELIHNPIVRGRGWQSVRDVEIAVAEYVDWYNCRRVHGQLDQRTPAGVEATYRASRYDQGSEPARAG
jgi:putative transposase